MLKKIIAVLFVVSMTSALSACSGNKSDVEDCGLDDLVSANNCKDNPLDDFEDDSFGEE